MVLMPSSGVRAGSGKTTLLRYLTYLQVRDDRAFALFVSGRSLDPARLVKAGQSFPSLVFEAAFTEGGAGERFAPRDPAAFHQRFMAAFLRGRAAFYVDRLDALSAENGREASALVEAFRTSIPPGNSLVLSTTDVESASIHDGLTVYRLLPLNRRQIDAFLYSLASDERTADQLESHLAAHPGLLEGLSNPRLLTLYGTAVTRLGGQMGLGFNWCRQVMDAISTDRRVVL